MAVQNCFGWLPNGRIARWGCGNGRRNWISGAWASAAEEEVAEAKTLLLHAVEQAASPNEVNGQQAEAQSNGKPSGPRSQEQHHAESEERETGEDSERPSRFLKRF
jgi:hypothetical protein